LSRLGWEYRRVGIVIRTLRTRVLGISDRKRWCDLRNHDITWDKRTRNIAALIAPDSNVIEFGAGRRQLPRWLPPNCDYVASDIVARGEGTLLCDLNKRPLPSLPHKTNVQVAVFSGVLEYVVDVPGVINWLSTHVDQVIASYNCITPTESALGRIRAAAARLSAGWVNGFTQSELIASFNKAGFALIKCQSVEGEEAEHIYFFAKSRSRDLSA
jgi:hypothetical protein